MKGREKGPPVWWKHKEGPRTGSARQRARLPLCSGAAPPAETTRARPGHLSFSTVVFLSVSSSRRSGFLVR